MKINTIPGKTYAVASSNGATITTEAGLQLLSVEAGVQGCFVAPGSIVECSDAEANITLAVGGGAGGSGGGAGGALDKELKELCKHVDDASVHVSEEEKAAWNEAIQGLDDHIEDDECHVSNEERESWNATKGELEALVKKQQVTVDVSTPEGATNANYNFIHLSGSVKEGTLYKVTHRTRNTPHNRLTTEPRWLGVFEQREGEVYEKVGVSQNTVQQVIGEPSEWLFEGVELSGAPIRLCLLVNSEDDFSDNSQFGGVVSDSDGADYVSNDGRITNSVPDLTMSLAVDGLREHVGDAVRHITAAERDRWNGAGDGAAAAQAAAQAAQNTANAALNNANLANTNLTKEKNEALQHLYWHHSGNNAALAALMGDNGAAYFPEAKHVTEAERNKWNAYQNTLNSKVDSTTLSSHTGNTSVHLSAEDRKKFNNIPDFESDTITIGRSYSVEGKKGTITFRLNQYNGSADFSWIRYISPLHPDFEEKLNSRAGFHFFDSVGPDLTDFYITFKEIEKLQRLAARADDLLALLDQ